MRTGDFAELQAFAAIIRHGTFTRAAAHLGQSPSALSQTIRNLEDRLGLRLLNRTTRSVSPTDAGARMAERLLPVLDDLEAVAARAAETGDRPIGVLRLNVNRFAARHVMAPLLTRFLSRYPGIIVEMDVNDTLVDIVAGGFDAGVRLGERLEGDMIAVPLGGPIEMAVVAAPSYLGIRGTPLHPHDLTGHTCIGMRWPTDRSPYRWEFEREAESLRIAVTGPLVCDDPDVRLAAAVDGLGVAILFEHESRGLTASGQLVRVLKDWTPPFPGCFLYFPGRRHLSPALRALIDFSKEPDGLQEQPPR